MRQSYKDVLANHASRLLLEQVLEMKGTKEAEPVFCPCSGCRPVDPHPYGCIKTAGNNDWQAGVGY